MIASNELTCLFFQFLPFLPFKPVQIFFFQKDANNSFVFDFAISQVSNNMYIQICLFQICRTRYTKLDYKINSTFNRYLHLINLINPCSQLSTPLFFPNQSTQNVLHCWLLTLLSITVFLRLSYSSKIALLSLITFVYLSIVAFAFESFLAPPSLAILLSPSPSSSPSTSLLQTSSKLVQDSEQLSPPSHVIQDSGLDLHR